MEAPGEKLLIKMWETLTEKGIGCLLRPWQIRRDEAAKTESKVYDIITTRQAEIQANALLRNHQLTSLSPSPELDRLLDSKIKDAIAEEVSIAKAIGYAENLISEESIIDSSPDSKPSNDWMHRWKGYTKKNTDEEILNLWGRILAGEVASPGKYNYRFLSFLDTLTSTDALLISDLAKMCIGNFYVRSKGGNDEISMENLLYLQSLGVIQGVESFGLQRSFSSTRANKFELFVPGKTLGILIEHDDPTKILSLSNTCGLTDIGLAAVALCQVETSLEYGRNLVKLLNGQNFNSKLARFQRVEGNTVRIKDFVN